MNTANPNIANPNTANPNTSLRRHDLDALRGVAMLLGIFLHAAIAYAPVASLGWPVQNPQTSRWFGVFIDILHGFRMPLFFLLSGFFTMMLFRRRGMQSLIEHRFKRIALPLLLGMFTIVPAVWIVGAYVQANPSDAKPSYVAGDLLTPTLHGDFAVVEQAIADGADVNQLSDQGDTPLLVASFLGRDEIAKALLDAGADPAIANKKGERPIDVMRVSWTDTQVVAGWLKVEVDQQEVESGRESIAAVLGESLLADATINQDQDDVPPSIDWAGLNFLLFQFPLTSHLWFLWFLCWLVAGFVIVMLICPAAIRGRWNAAAVTRSPICLLWWVPLTMVPQWLMPQDTFGPSTSSGLIPMPMVLAYYAIFFGFGAIYYDADDRIAALGRHWWILLPLAAIALVIATGMLRVPTTGLEQFGFIFMQSVYAWLASIGMMGLFHRAFSNPSRALRYLSDSSYWLYLAHLPLVMWLQYWCRDMDLSPPTKFAVVNVISATSLLLSYQILVRHTPIGWLLNGKQKRSADAEIVTAQLVEN